MSREHPTPAEDSLHHLSTALHLVQRADADLQTDPAPARENLYAHAGVAMVLALGMREHVDHLARHVRSLTAVHFETTDNERLGHANRQLNTARVALHQAHEALHAATGHLYVEMPDGPEQPVNG